uniref:Uncharacterized protein n=1 Tax=Arundo donax TaxID=35708 RepID=A0A0A9F6Y1_ARUDO
MYIAQCCRLVIHRILINLQLPDEFLSLADSLFVLSMRLVLLIPDSILCSLIIPFLRLGEAVTGSGHFPLTSDALKNVLTGHASKGVLLSIVHAMLGWLIAAPFVLGVLYTVSVPCFKILVDRFGSTPLSPRTPIKAV